MVDLVQLITGANEQPFLHSVCETFSSERDVSNDVPRTLRMGRSTSKGRVRTVAARARSERRCAWCERGLRTVLEASVDIAVYKDTGGVECCSVGLEESVDTPVRS
jgi:hypothetical protein